MTMKLTPTARQAMLQAQLSFQKPAFGRPAGGVIGARAIPESEALADGKPTWARISDGGGGTIMDIDVGGVLQLSTETIGRGDPVSILSIVLRMPAKG